MQVSWLGYPNTHRPRAIDWRISDAIADPPAATTQLSSEGILRLPRLPLLPAARRRAGGRPAAEARGGRITFGSFNNLRQAQPRDLRAVGRDPRGRARARLLLKIRRVTTRSPRSADLERFAAQGIDPARLDILPRAVDAAAHLAAYAGIDIALDPFPYNGTTTTCEALWMGVPVSRFAGDRHAARVGASLLHRVGLDDLVAAGTRRLSRRRGRARPGPGAGRRLRAGLRERRCAPRSCAMRPVSRAPSRPRIAPCGAPGARPRRRTDPADGSARAMHAPHAFNLAALIAAGNEQLAARRLAEAEALYRQAEALAPSHPEVLHALGLVSWRHGALIAADGLIAAAIAADPAPAAYHDHHGLVLAALGRSTAAEAAHRRALALDPRLAAAYNNLANLLRVSGRAAEALEAVDQALARDAGQPVLHLNRGEILAGLGRPREAAESFASALRLRPDYADAFFALGQSWQRTDNQDGARFALRSYLKLEPTDRHGAQALLALIDAAATPAGFSPAYVRNLFDGGPGRPLRLASHRPSFRCGVFSSARAARRKAAPPRSAGSPARRCRPARCDRSRGPPNTSNGSSRRRWRTTHRDHVARFRHLVVTLRSAGAILLVSVPATIITSDCLGDARGAKPKRSAS